MEDFLQRIMSILGRQSGSAVTPEELTRVQMPRVGDTLQVPQAPGAEQMPVDLMSLLRMLRPGNQHAPNAFQGINGNFVQPPQQFPHRLNNTVQMTVRG